jgi:hypothetical protein
MLGAPLRDQKINLLMLGMKLKLWIPGFKLFSYLNAWSGTKTLNSKIEI